LSIRSAFAFEINHLAFSAEPRIIYQDFGPGHPWPLFFCLSCAAFSSRCSV